LRTLVAVLAETLRAEDVLARMGGEEFAILVRGVSKDNALVLGERLRRVVETINLKHDDQPLPLTVSVGISLFPIADGPEGAPAEQTGAKLLADADAALYRAKTAGRNRVEL
jgi:diguanylate cyclase